MLSISGNTLTVTVELLLDISLPELIDNTCCVCAEAEANWSDKLGELVVLTPPVDDMDAPDELLVTVEALDPPECIELFPPTEFALEE